jgi:hypothetical protein
VTSASLDQLLAVLVLAMAATGLLTLRAGSPETGWLFTLHDLIAGALAVAIGMKVRRSLPRAMGGRRWAGLALALAVSLVAVAALTGGILWVASGELLTVGPWTVLTLHAWAGLVLVPLVILHLVPRRWRLLRPSVRGACRLPDRLLSRRSLLAGGTLGLGSIALWGAAAFVDRLRGGARRFTGSRWLPTAGVPPATTFFGEPTPSIDLAAWRLFIRGRVARERSWSLADLRALGETDHLAVLDCTSGWAIETPWRGVPLSAVLAAAGVADGAARVEVRSVTGWGASLSIEEARTCVLATGVAGGDLPLPNGAPCRLVVPDRRGLDWVKWVAEVVVA